MSYWNSARLGPPFKNLFIYYFSHPGKDEKEVKKKEVKKKIKLRARSACVDKPILYLVPFST